MKNRPRRPFGPASAIALVCANLAACADPITGPTDFGDGGVGAAAGQITMHTASTNLPVLVATVSLSLGTMQPSSDREPSAHPTVALTGDIGMEADDPVLISGATPGTYGGARLVALDGLRVTTTTGSTFVVTFTNVAPIELRCAGPGKYLDPSSAIDMRLSLDFAAVQPALVAAGAYLPATPGPQPVPATSALYTALSGALSVTCLP